MSLGAAVMTHAKANYSKGWDVIVECMTESSIDAQCAERGITTKRAAIKEYGAQAKLWKELESNCY